MSVELEAKKITVATAQKDCEELLVEIVSERRVADEQKKQASRNCRAAFTPPVAAVDAELRMVSHPTSPLCCLLYMTSVVPCLTAPAKPIGL